jgi:hypothetical protein
MVASTRFNFSARNQAPANDCKLDGQESPVKCVTLTEKDETYMLMSFKEAGITHRFYMLTGSDLTPAEAQRTYKIREGMLKPKVEA